jgi:hypothetical protein
MAYTKYSLTPSSNTAAPPDGAPEGMLPSAVNDTMRDMMAQIRDCGDGIRGGTYTLTAPVVTGGSINGATVGATTASTGKFSTLTNAALTSGRVTYAGTAGLLQDDADLTFDGSTLTTLNAAYTGTLTGGTGIVNLGSGQFYKDASGNVCIGTTTTFGSSRFNVAFSGENTDTAYIKSTASSPYGMEVVFSASPNNTTNYFMYAEDGTNAKFAVYSSGTVTNRTGTYNAFSDIKLKQDIEDASSQWNDIKSIRVRKFRLKDDVIANANAKPFIGVVAQELELTSPNLIDESPDFKKDEEGNRIDLGTTTKSVKYSIIYMKAVKALQEAMERIEQSEALIENLTTRLNALEEK